MFATIVSLDWQWQQGHGCQWVLQNMIEKNFWFSFSVFFCCCFVDISSPSFNFAPTTFFLQTQDKKMKTPCFYFFFSIAFFFFSQTPQEKFREGEGVTFLLNDDGNNNGCLAWQWREHGCCKNTRPKKNTKWQWQQGHGCCKNTRPKKNTKWQWQQGHGCWRLNTRPKHTPTHKNKKDLKKKLGQEKVPLQLLLCPW